MESDPAAVPLPEIPRGDGAIWPPFFPDFPQFRGLWPPGELIHVTHRFLQAQVIDRKNIRSAEYEHQEHLRSPPPHAFDGGQCFDDLLILHRAEFASRDAAIDKMLGQVFEIPGFLPRESALFWSLVMVDDFQHAGGRRPSARKL